VVAFNAAHPEQALRFGQDLFLAAAATKGDLSEPEYRAARRNDLRSAKRHGLDAYIRMHKLDAVLFPGASGAAIAAKAGYPSVQVPAGYICGIAEQDTPDYPFGVSFTGRAWSEGKLLRLAYAYEQATLVRRMPPDLG
jgi:amidase